MRLNQGTKMSDILDEPFKEEKEIELKEKKKKRTDFQKATRHTWIGWIAFGVCLLMAVLNDAMELPKRGRNLFFMIGLGFSLYHIIMGTYYKMKRGLYK